MKYKYFIYLLIIAFIGSCKPELDEFTPDKGSADFSKYVSVGNSLTAGFTDGALYEQGQLNSYANILATQFKAVGGGEFKTPLLTYPGGIGTQTVGGQTLLIPYLKLTLLMTCMGEEYKPYPSDPNFIQKQPEMQAALAASVAAQGPFNNIGVPGAKSYHVITPGYATLNPFFGRFASNANNTVLNEAAPIAPTFFSIWLGSNDVLDYALSGGDEAGPAHAITTMGPDPIIGHPGFSAAMDAVIGSMVQIGATDSKGVLLNVPDVLAAPYFTAIPYNGIYLTQEEADQLNGFWQMHQVPGIQFNAGLNPPVVMNADSSIRQLNQGEIILAILSDSIQCGKFLGRYAPIPGNYFLSIPEIQKIDSAVTNYNTEINNLLTKYNANVAFVDIHKLLKDAEKGIFVEGISFSTAGVEGNIFGLDGLHLSPQGNALIAHFIIEKINATFGAKVPQVNIAAYPSIFYP
ncbi:MAG: SGNH/GDSL hydrolase family protein [Bacteroidetes bacterium]|nr:SGNH/GDSL hydrolase family protein [Bacteroidota bacterium]